MKKNKEVIQISKLFPNKKLTKQEVSWVRNFYNFFGIEPMSTEAVRTDSDFWKMTEVNIEWLEHWVNDGIRRLEQKRRDLPYHDRMAYRLESKEPDNAG